MASASPLQALVVLAALDARTLLRLGTLQALVVTTALDALSLTSSHVNSPGVSAPEGAFFWLTADILSAVGRQETKNPVRYNKPKWVCCNSRDLFGVYS